MYKDRTYYCYGPFLENGLVYTVVKRLDLPYQVCFVGTNLESMITEAGTSCGRDKEPRTSEMLLSYRSDQYVEWQWEEISKGVSPKVSNTQTVNAGNKNRPEISSDINEDTIAMQVPVTIIVLHDENMQDKQYSLEHEVVSNLANVLNMNVIKVNLISNAITIYYSFAMLVIVINY